MRVIAANVKGLSYNDKPLFCTWYITMCSFIASNPSSPFWILSHSFGEKSKAVRQNPEWRAWVRGYTFYIPLSKFMRSHYSTYSYRHYTNLEYKFEPKSSNGYVTWT